MVVRQDMAVRDRDKTRHTCVETQQNVSQDSLKTRHVSHHSNTSVDLAFNATSNSLCMYVIL